MIEVKFRRAFLLFLGMLSIVFGQSAVAQKKLQTSSHWVLQLKKTKNILNQRRIILILGQFYKQDSVAFSAIKQASIHQNKLIRASAMWAMRTMGTKALPILLKGLFDRSSLVRASALEAITKLNSHDPKVINAYVRLVSDRDRMIQIAAIQALAKLGQKAPLIAVQKIEAIGRRFLRRSYHKRPILLRNIMWALGQTARKSTLSTTVSVLAKGSHNRNEGVRFLAIQSLKNPLYSSSKMAVLALQFRLRDRVRKTRNLAKKTLKKWKKPLIIPQKRDRLKRHHLKKKTLAKV